MAQHGSKRLQIRSGRGHLFDDEGFLAGLGRKRIKNIKTTVDCLKNSSYQLEIALMAKNSSMAQYGLKRLKMEVATVEVLADVTHIGIALKQNC